MLQKNLTKTKTEMIAAPTDHWKLVPPASRRQTDAAQACTDLRCSSASSRTSRSCGDETAAAGSLCRSRRRFAATRSTSRPLCSQLHNNSDVESFELYNQSLRHLLQLPQPLAHKATNSHSKAKPTWQPRDCQRMPLFLTQAVGAPLLICLLYTSDAADE